jgi:hypothetical protein
MTIHNREPCFFCEHREREPGQVLCSVCIAWAEVVRGGEVYQRTLQTVNEIEHMLRMYEVPIMAPLADSVMRVCEHNERLRDLLDKCKLVVGSDDLHREIEEALNDLP